MSINFNSPEMIALLGGAYGLPNHSAAPAVHIPVRRTKVGAPGAKNKRKKRKAQKMARRALRKQK